MSSPSQGYIPLRYLQCVPKINSNIIIPAKYKVTVATLQEVVNEMYERFAKAIDDIHTIHAYDVNNLKDKINQLSTRLSEFDSEQEQAWTDQAEINNNKSDEMDELRSALRELRKPITVSSTPTSSSKKADTSRVRSGSVPGTPRTEQQVRVASDVPLEKRKQKQLNWTPAYPNHQRRTRKCIPLWLLHQQPHPQMLQLSCLGRRWCIARKTGSKKKR